MEDLGARARRMEKKMNTNTEEIPHMNTGTGDCSYAQNSTRQVLYFHQQLSKLIILQSHLLKSYILSPYCRREDYNVYNLYWRRAFYQ